MADELNTNADHAAGRRPQVPGVLREDRPQPFNKEAERAVLASMIGNPSFCIDFVIEKFGSEKGADKKDKKTETLVPFNPFYAPEHRTIYDALLEMHKDDKSGIDLISLCHYLNKKKKLDAIGGQMALMEIQSSIASDANLESWCEIVLGNAILRSMINTCSELLTKCYDQQQDPTMLLDEIEKEIFKVRFRHTKQNIQLFPDLLKLTFKELLEIINKQKDTGIMTGYDSLDRLTGGLKPAEMFVLAARPSIGKTALALNILRNIVLKNGGGRPVAFFSLEMSSEQIARRLICMESEVSESSFSDGSFKPQDIAKLTKALNVLSQAKVFIDPTPGLTIPELRAKARRLKQEHNIELVMIDYLQLMKLGGVAESRQIEVSGISSGLKALAKELNIPVLVLAQLNREVEKGSPKSSKPKLSHLRESGSIEQDADIVTFIHRDRNDAKNESAALKNGVETELIVEKNRNGRTGYATVRFYPHIMQFREQAHRFDEEDRPAPES